MRGLAEQLLHDAGTAPLWRCSSLADLLVGMPLQPHLNDSAVIGRLPLQHAFPLLASNGHFHWLRPRIEQLLHVRSMGPVIL